MRADQGGPRPNSSRPRHRQRQLTIGECIAIARYAPSWLTGDGAGVDERGLYDFISRIGVCTTCGWPEKWHRQDPAHQQAIGCCAHYTREL